MPHGAALLSQPFRPTSSPLACEIARLESIVRTWIGDTDEAVRQLAVFFAANPNELEGYRNDAQRGQLIWYHKDLLKEPKFRSLVGLR